MAEVTEYEIEKTEVKTIVTQVPMYKLTLTKEEATVIAALTGRAPSNGPFGDANYDVFKALYNAGVRYPQRLFSEDTVILWNTKA